MSKNCSLIFLLFKNHIRSPPNFIVADIKIHIITITIIISKSVKAFLFLVLIFLNIFSCKII